MAAVRNGVGREAAHEAIKEHAVAVALEMRQGPRRQRPVRPARRRRPARPDRASSSTPWSPTRSTFTGAARDQVASVVRRVEEVLAGDPGAASYRPAGIL